MPKLLVDVAQCIPNASTRQTNAYGSAVSLQAAVARGACHERRNELILALLREDSVTLWIIHSWMRTVAWRSSGRGSVQSSCRADKSGCRARCKSCELIYRLYRASFSFCTRLVTTIRELFMATHVVAHAARARASPRKKMRLPCSSQTQGMREMLCSAGLAHAASAPQAQGLVELQ